MKMETKLLKLMQQYPDVEVIPMVDWESNNGEYSTSTSNITGVKYSEYVMIDGYIYDDKNDAIEKLWDNKYGNKEFEAMNEKEQEKLLKLEYSKFELEKAIFVYIG